MPCFSFVDLYTAEHPSTAQGLESKLEAMAQGEEDGRAALSQARTRLTMLERKMGEMMAAVRKARGQTTEAERARLGE